MTDAAPARYPFLDAVRGLAAGGVLAYHFGGFFALAGPAAAGPAADRVAAACRYGWLGVQVFFVLSGFVVAMTAPATPSTAGAASRFLLRRLVRIAPPYWASVLAVVALRQVGRALGYGNRDLPFSTGLVLSHLAYAERAFGYPHLSDVYWTLCLEVQFYALFAVLLAAPRRAGDALAVALFAGGIAAGFAGYDSYDWFLRYWPGFALGVATWRARRGGRAAAVWAAGMAAVLAVGVARGEPEEFVLAGTSLALLAAARTGGLTRWLDAPSLTGLGKISYSLYLFHALVGSLVFYRLRPQLGQTGGGVFAIVAVAAAASLLTALAAYRVIERPSVRISKRIRVDPIRGRGA